MKKLLMSSILATSSIFALTACAGVNAATDSSAATQMQYKKGGMNNPFSELNLTASQQAQMQALRENKSGKQMQNREAMMQILTPEQREKMTQLRADRMAAAQKGSKGKQGAKGHMQKHNKGSKSGANSIHSQLNLTASQQAQMQALRENNRGEYMKNREAMMQILTPEQREKMTKLMADRMAAGQGQGMYKNK
jgi:protein CpxP